MQNLTRASRELFRRTPDETYASLEALVGHCRQQRETSADHWLSPNSLWAKPVNTDCLTLANGDDQSFHLNDWSFGQLCRLAGVTKETVNRLTSDTAARVFAETLPRGNKPLQVFSTGEKARSIHGAAYTRLHNAELLDIVLECADGFEPPPKGFNGGTGLYCGEQDMFCFLIDPTGWTEIGGEAVRPGFLPVELGGRPQVAGHRDVLVPGSLPEPHRLGCRGSRGVQPQTHGATSAIHWSKFVESSRPWQPSATSAAMPLRG